MSRRDYAAQIISELGAAMGLPALSLDDDGRASPLLDEVLFTLMVSDDPVELLWLFADLGYVGSDDPARLRRLLQLGFETWSLGHMTIGLDQYGRHAIGHSAIPVVDLDLVLLRNTLKSFVDTAMAVRAALASSDTDAGGGSGSQPGGSPEIPGGGLRV